MSLALEITLIVALVALVVGLLPLLYQLRQTAQGLDQFLLSSRKDLAQIAEDVHASRLRMDHLAATLQVTLVEVASFSRAIGEVGTTLKDLHTRFHNSIESASRNVGGVIGGISAVLAHFKSKPTPQEPE